MKILLNGQSHEIEAEMTVIALLDRLGLGNKPVVIEIDEQAVFPRDYSQIRISEGAKVEVVMLAAGG